MEYQSYRNALNAVLRLYGKPVTTELQGLAAEDGLPQTADEADRIIRSWSGTHRFVIRQERFSAPVLRVTAEKVKAVLLLAETSEGLIPLVLNEAGKDRFRISGENLQDVVLSWEETEKLIRNFGDEKLIVYTFLVLPEENNPAGKESSSRWSLIGKIGGLLRQHKKEIGHILIYAVISGIISLSLPLGVQSIISYVSSGQLVTSVVVLLIFIIAGLLISGSMQYMQLYISEHIQQKIFVSNAFSISQRVPKIQSESLHGKNAREMMNRFFEVVTLQKGTAVLLLEFSAAGLQILFGLLLISVYHPVFILPGLLLVILLLIVLRVTGPQGLSTSITESKYKYQVARWLEEMAGSMRSFKLTDSSEFVSGKTDQYVSGYLVARKKHFKILSIQYLSFILFKTLITGGLLAVGCYLVINNEISLGQFVSAEIIIILVMGAVEKMILKLDTIYDLLTAIGKISELTEMPVDENGKYPVPAGKKPGLLLEINELIHTLPGSKTPVLNGISFTAAPGEKICIAGQNGSGKTTLVQLLLGVAHVQSGTYTINGMPFCDLDRNQLMPQIGHITSMGDLFDGTVLENITLGRRGIDLNRVMEVIEIAGLREYIRQLPEGLNTRLVGGDQYTSGSIARKILYARCIIGNPKLIILDHFLSGVSEKEKIRLLDFLLNAKQDAGLIVVSSNPAVMQRCDKTIVLEQGKIAVSGSFEKIKTHESIRNLIAENKIV